MTREDRRTESWKLWMNVQNHIYFTGVNLREFTRRCQLPDRALEAFAQGKTKELNDTKLTAIKNYLDGRK